MAIELRVARGEDRAAICDGLREARRAALSYLPGLRSDEEDRAYFAEGMR